MTGKYLVVFRENLKISPLRHFHHWIFMVPMSTLKMKNGDLAIEWFDKALAINPNYQPAVDAKATLKK
jgi:hypothetical protein